MILWTVLLSFLVLATPIASESIVVLSGNVSCHLNRDFSYRVQITKDESPLAKVLITSPLKRSSQTMSPYEVIFRISDDGFSKKAKLTAYVAHDCYKNNKQLTARYNLGIFTFTEQYQHVTYNFDITNEGKGPK